MENLLQRSHHKVEIISNDLNETISKVHEKLRRVDETSTVKDWVYTLVEESKKQWLSIEHFYLQNIFFTI